MSDRIFLVLTLLATLSAGLMAGFFFTFSNSVMQALARVPVSAGIQTMQALNVTVLNPLFFAGFFGTALLGILLGVMAVLNWTVPGSAYLVAGGALYMVGVFLVTVIFNVPMNEALGTVDPASVQGAEMWRDYLSRWVAWNHVRTLASFATFAAFAMALIKRA
ncbi:DUF1772 domain-containing protein [Nitratireductor pacificus]|uniref:Integral membrane protein n=1 Tax=Nitratireductor pacificus pht-3B TaxID=391937 RepID=K2MJ05_9HYPH|nr:anthrone oxygenase family protein [Nitratireductor pacificus]EKF20670.1 hypothetical protein NA2_02759 [Nitratireductor pacificus pht-3B]